MENKKTLNNIPEWKPDVLGEDFLMRHVSQGCDMQVMYVVPSFAN